MKQDYGVSWITALSKNPEQHFLLQSHGPVELTCGQRGGGGVGVGGE